MALTNNLKKQIDTPVWEWTRLAPGTSSAVSSTCTADNSLYHVTFGRYIYYMQAAATLATTTALTGFFRYDTISDSYQLLAHPPIAPTAYSGMQFAGGQGYYGRVLSATVNTITAAALTGQVLKGFDIRIINGAGDSQQRIITGVTDPVIADSGTLTAVQVTPQNYVTDANKNWTINQWVGYQVRFVSASGQSQIRKIMYNTSNTLYFADVAKFAEDQFAWCPITTIAGSAQVIVAIGSLYQIESSVITVDSPWTIQPDAGSYFVVRSGGIWLITSATNYALQYYDVAADTWYIRNGGSASSPVLAVGTDATIVNSGENASIWDRGIASGASNDTTHLQDTTKNWAVNQWAGYYVRIFSGTGEGQVKKIDSNTANTLAWTGAGTAPDATSRYFLEAFESGTLTSVGAQTQTGVSTGTINGNVFTAGATTGTYYPGQILTGTGVQASQILLSPSLACYTTGNSATVTFATGNPSTMGITAGMLVTVYAIGGGGVIPAGTVVSSVTSSTVVMSASTTTALNGSTLQFSSVAILSACTTNSALSLYVTCTSTAGLYTGAYLTLVSGTGTLASNSYVASIVDGTHFTLSAPPTVALNAAVLQAQPYQTVLMNQLTGIIGGAGTYTVYPSQTVASTTITGKGVGTVTDNTKSWLPDRWNNYVIRIKSGTGAGQARQITRTLPGAVTYTSDSGATSSGKVITVASTTGLTVGMALNITAGTGAFAPGTYVVSVNNSTTFTVSDAPTTVLSGGSTVVTGAPYNTLRVTPAWATAPSTDSIYVIHGDTDKNYFSLAGNAPTFIHNIESDLVTSGRLLDSGVARGISAQYSDYIPVAVSSGVPVLPITSAIGYIAGTGVATTGASNTGNVATITYTTAATASIFPVGSWITVAGVTATAYNGTWQVCASGVGTVSFYSTTATGTHSVPGTIAQANSVVLGGTLASGAYAALGAGTTVTISGAVPVAYNGTVTVSCGAAGTTGQAGGGYQSAAGATSSGTNNTVGDTTGLRAGMIPVVTAGVGAYPANTYITSITNSTTFVTNNAASPALSGGASVVTVYPSFAWAAGTVAGNMTTLGVAQKVPQAILSGGRTASATAVVLTAVANPTIFPVGSWIVVSGCTPATYNGVFQVTASNTAGSFSYVTSVSTTDTITVVGTVGLATNKQLVTTVANHNYQTGQTITIKGDQGFSATTNNASGTISVVAPSTIGNPSNQFVWNAASATAPMVVYPQATNQLQDGSKNWLPNQWAGCLVTYNYSQFTTANVQPNICYAYILSNTATTLIFAAALTNPPIQGVSRYVISTPATYNINNMLGVSDCGLAQGAAAGQTTAVLTDVTKSWATPAAIAGVTATSVSGATCTVSSIVGLYPGMMVAVTLGNTSLPAGTVINSINPATPSVTLSNSFSANNNCTLTFLACCQSSGNTITVNGYPLTNLAVGMNVGVTSVANISAAVPTAGAFVLNGGVNLTSVKVTAITGVNTFTVSSAPTIPLVNATVQASFWFPNQWVNRRLRQLSGNVTYASSEQIITANTYNTLTVTTVFGATHAHGVTAYAILQQPLRGAGTALIWNFGSSDPAKAGKYLYQARGGNLSGWDRLNLTNDTWEFLSPTPNFETINTGAMFAYDGVDRIYFTVQVTQRVYYIDIDTLQIHPAGMYPYAAGTAIVGNRMEIFETTDGLKYLWLNRHSNVECFRQLLWY